MRVFIMRHSLFEVVRAGKKRRKVNKREVNPDKNIQLHNLYVHIPKCMNSLSI